MIGDISMRSNKKITTIMILVSIIAILFFVITLFFALSFIDGNPVFLWVSTVLSTAILTGILTNFLRSYNQSETLIRIAMLGYPYSGKTVYITVLYNYLETKKSTDGIDFSIRGTETAERIAGDISTLEDGRALPPTPNEHPFLYRGCVATSKLSLKKYEIQIVDYAGQKLEGELLKGDGFFHRTEYYKHMAACDILFITVDLDKVKDNLKDSQYIRDIEKHLRTAMGRLLEDRIAGYRRRKFPVALLFLKEDLIEEDDKSNVREKLKDLIVFCENKCENFEVFFVSSLGCKLENLNGGIIYPKDIDKPFIWALKTHG